jgi:hypothetical protein
LEVHLNGDVRKPEFRFLIAIGVLASLALSMYMILMSRLFRPIADDYLVTAHSQNGPFQASWYWYQTWSGDLISGFNNSLLVGIPSLHFDWNYSSAVPYWITVLVLALSILQTVFRALSSVSLTKWKLCVAAGAGIMLINLMWIAFWWTSPSLGGARPEIAVAATMWQNVTVNYVFDQYLFIFLMLTSRFWKLRSLTLKNFIYAGLIGIIAGLSGVVSGLTLLTLCTIGFFLFRYALRIDSESESTFSKDQGRKATSNFVLVVGTFCSLGIYIALSAPGLENRSIIEADYSIPDKSFIALTNYVVGSALSTWYDGISSAGSLVVIFASIAVGAAAAQRISVSSLKVREIQTIGAVFLIASIFESAISRLSEAYSYPAYWHIVGQRSLMFTGILITGLAIGFHFISVLDFGIKVVMVPVLLGTSFLVFGSLVFFGSVVNERHQNWNLGPAQIFAVPDIDEAWRYGCYLETAANKSSPTRSLGSDPDTEYKCLYFDRVAK